MTDTDKRLHKVRTHKLIGKIFLGIVIIVLVISLFSKLNTILVNQSTIIMQNNDVLNQQNNILVEMDKQMSPADRALIERIVMSESGGEGLEAQMAVAQTIYDRMNDFGDSLNKAVETYSQHDNGAPTDSVKLAVENVFDKGARVYEGGTYQFHDDSVLPYWAEGKISRGSIGNLRFYGGYENEL